MKLPTLTTSLALLSFLTTGSALPAPELEIRQTTLYLTLYQDVAYGGRAARLLTSSGICFELMDEDRYFASSAKTASGWKCTLYTDILCKGSSLVITSAGNSNFVASNFNDVALSFNCGAA